MVTPIDFPYECSETYDDTWGSWIHQHGKKKSNGEPVSIFFAFSTDEAQLATWRDSLDRIKKVSFAHILPVKLWTEVKGDGGATIIVVTEQVLPVHEMTKALKLKGIKREEFNEYGLYGIVRAIYLLNDHSLGFGEFSRNRVFLSRSLKSKLFAFDVAASTTSNIPKMSHPSPTPSVVSVYDAAVLYSKLQFSASLSPENFKEELDAIADQDFQDLEPLWDTHLCTATEIASQLMPNLAKLTIDPDSAVREKALKIIDQFLHLANKYNEQANNSGNKGLHREGTSSSLPDDYSGRQNPNISEQLGDDTCHFSAIRSWQRSIYEQTTPPMGTNTRSTSSRSRDRGIIVLPYRSLCIPIIGYLMSSLLVFIFREWFTAASQLSTFWDALYLTAVTLFGVGYGDIVPSRTVTRIICDILAILGSVIQYIVGHFISRLVIYLLRRFMRRDMQLGRPRRSFGLIWAIFMIVVSILLSGVGIYFFEPPLSKIPWYALFHLAIMTATTVGYGDVAFSTRAGRIFASLWIPFISSLYSLFSIHVIEGFCRA